MYRAISSPDPSRLISIILNRGSRKIIDHSHLHSRFLKVSSTTIAPTFGGKKAGVDDLVWIYWLIIYGYASCIFTQVSYKWLSRSYLISSDTAKRLLQEFVEKHESGLQVVYALSGWLKNDPPSYHIRLVSDSKLPVFKTLPPCMLFEVECLFQGLNDLSLFFTIEQKAKQDFDGTCSIQVYSVQASIPKDPAALWNAEFVQAEELFKQPFTVDNCLRDNRFCGISNSYVKRSIGEIPASVAAPQPRSAVGAESTKKNESCQNTAIPQPQKSEMHKVNPNVGLQSPPVVKEVKGENNSTGSFHQTSKPIAVKEKVASLPANKKRPQSDKPLPVLKVH
ncbi:hypothetical protein SDJN03_01266, partial [Cucurbita argyrosperma subsp. sororia]